jgi:putative ABC transport system permease protein
MTAIALTVLIFSILRTIVFEWKRGSEEAANDRLAVRDKISITTPLPRTYIDTVRAEKGVKAATWANWFGAKDPKERVPFFAGFAVDPETWFDVYDDMKVEPAQLAEFKKTRECAILGDMLAKTFEVSVGQDVTITSDIYPGDWKFKVCGIYQPLKRTVDRNTFVFRWDLLNDDTRSVFMKDKIGWMLARIDDPSQSAAISKQIDKDFDSKDDQTQTMSEREFQNQFMGGFVAILDAFDYISIVILIILGLVLANTIATSVRERTHEYGVLRAIGFPPGHIAGFILGESVLIALTGGLIGVGLTAVLVNKGLGPFLEEHMGNWFPYFSVPSMVMVIALGAAAAIGVVSGILPAIRASKRKVTDALRRLD